MKATLKKFFTSAATHHTAMAKLAATAMNGCEEDSDERTMHKSAMDSHISHAECCAECAKACDKADSSDFEKLIPSAVSRVTPTAPGIRMVPRAGQQMPTMPEVDKDFADLVSIEGGE